MSVPKELDLAHCRNWIEKHRRIYGDWMHEAGGIVQYSDVAQKYLEFCDVLESAINELEQGRTTAQIGK